MAETWTIARMLEWMQSYLAEHGDEKPLISSRWLISDVIGMSFMDLYTNLDRPLSKDELDKLRGYVRRRAEGEPLQYITGTTTFRHIDIAINEDVLIPRPETEVLVSEVLELLPKQKYNAYDGYEHADDAEGPLVADLCTGSGCIACSIAYENPNAKVIATDISASCVDLARANAAKLGLEDRVSIVECDLGEGIGYDHMGAFDVVVSNPPYIPTDVLQSLPSEVACHEPQLALDGGEDGLDVFRRIAKWSIDALRDGGTLACELHETTLGEASEIARGLGFADARIIKDLAGKERVLLARKDGSRE